MRETDGSVSESKANSATAVDAGFYFKSVRADEHDYFEKLLHRVYRSALSNSQRSALRFKGNRPRYTIKQQQGGRGCLRIFDRDHKSAPMYDHAHKRDFSKAMPATYANVSAGFLPKVFDWDTKTSTCLVGVKFKPEHVLINRIFYDDINTYVRNYDAPTWGAAVHRLQYYAPVMATRLADLIERGETDAHNEVLIRASAIDGILIFNDNLQSRLLAQYRCERANQRLRDVEIERGIVAGSLGMIGIEFYDPSADRPLQPYTLEMQRADKVGPDAEKILAKFASKPAVSYCQAHNILPIHRAAARGDIKALEAVINVDSLNLQDDFGRTALHLSAENGHLEAVKLLLAQSGIALALKTSTCDTALDMAARCGHVDVVKALLASGVRSRLAQMHACKAAHLGVVEAILSSKRYRERTLRAIYSRLLYYSAALDKPEQVAYLLANKPVDVDAEETMEHATALMAASRVGALAAVEALLAAGASLDCVDNEGSTALILAAQFGRADVLRLLLARGANMHAARTDGRTALHMAIEVGDQACVRLLADAGAKVSASDSIGASSFGLWVGTLHERNPAFKRALADMRVMDVPEATEDSPEKREYLECLTGMAAAKFAKT